MRRTHADRIWMIGGAAVALLLLAVGWFVAIKPKNAETASLKRQIAASEGNLRSLRSQLAELQAEQAKLPASRALLLTRQAALPADSGVPDFLRQLQDSGDEVGVDVSAVSVSTPERSKAISAVFELPITVTADGTAVNLGRFLDQLQTEQPRAVLIESANLSTAGGETPDSMSVSISLTAFVAPTGAPNAAVPATTK